jgi:phospholipid/cholesterol/gamma-HCH transport system substrate-binding protein
LSKALARNSSCLDQILEALERLGGGGFAETPTRIYGLSALHVFPPIDKVASGQLTVPKPNALVPFGKQKTLVRPQVKESLALDAQWSDRLPKLLQAKIIQSFENADYPQVVARPTEGLTADYQLLTDLRSFQVALLPKPGAEVEFLARILGRDCRLVASRCARKRSGSGDRCSSGSGRPQRGFWQGLDQIVGLGVQPCLKGSA